MVIEILTAKDMNLFEKVCEIFLQTLVHWAAAWILAISFFFLFGLTSIPFLYFFGDDVFGTPLQETLWYIREQPGWNTFDFFMHFNWYYKTAFSLGMFFPFAHYILDFE
jgi:hypothetical protein